MEKKGGNEMEGQKEKKEKSEISLGEIYAGPR